MREVLRLATYTDSIELKVGSSGRIVEKDGKPILTISGNEVLDWDERGAPVFGYDAEKNPVCYANTAKGRCMHQNRTITGRCLSHSRVLFGKTKQSKIMIKNVPYTLAEDYERIVADPNLLSLRDDIAVMEARIQQLYRRAEEMYDPEIWETVQMLSSRVHSMAESGEWATSPEKMRKFHKAIDDLHKVVSRGGKDEAIWEEIARAKELKAKLIGQEQKMLQTLRGFVTKEQVAALMTALAQAVKIEVAMELPGSRGEVLTARIAGRMQDLISGRARESITVMNGIPLVPIEVRDGKMVS